MDGTLTINKRPVKLVSADATKEYDGTPLTNKTVTDTVEGEYLGFVKGEGATYDVTGSQTNVGESENKFGYELNEGTEAANYAITIVFGTLTVTGDKLIPNKTTPKVESNYKLGDEILFDITVENVSDAEVKDVVVEDENATIVTGAGYTVVNAHKATIASIASGEKVIVRAKHTVTSDDILAGTVGNKATVSWEGTTKDVEASTDDIVSPDTRLTVTKKSDKEGQKVKLGEKITYTITVKNEGNVPYYNVNVDDDLTAMHANIAELLVGAEKEFTTYYTVTSADILNGSVLNSVTAKGSPIDDPKDPKNPKTPEGEDEIEDETEDVDVTLTVTKESDKAGQKVALNDTITYTITVKNDGNVPYFNVKVDDKLTGLYEVIAELPVGAKKEFTTSYTVTEADILAGSVTNKVTAKGDPINDPKDPKNQKTPEGEAEVTDNTEDVKGDIAVIKRNVDRDPDATGVKKDDERTYRYGDTVHYKIWVTNEGNVTLSSVVVTDDVEGVIFEAGEGYTVGSDGRTATIDTLAIGATVTLKAAYAIRESDIKDELSFFKNTVRVSGETPVDVTGYDFELVPVQGKQGLRLVASSAEKNYDRNELTRPEYTVYLNDKKVGTVASGESLALPYSGDIVTATVEGTITYVGEVLNKITAYSVLNASEKDMSVNYDIEPVDGTLTIHQVYTELNATKEWIRPKIVEELGEGYPEITVIVKQDGAEYGRLTITAEDEWHASMTDLPVAHGTDDPGEYVYTAEEVLPAGYSKSEGLEPETLEKLDEHYEYRVTNVMGTTSFSGTKTWEMLDTEWDGTTETPDVTIHLLRNGENYRDYVIASGEEGYEFNDLPTHDPNGERYVYKAEEEVPAGYESTKTETEKGADFTNRQVGYTYTVKYYRQMLEDNELSDKYELVEDETETYEHIGYGWTLIYDKKDFEGFYYEKTMKTLTEGGEEIEFVEGDTMPANNELEIHVYYVRRTDLTYTIEYRLNNAKGRILSETKVVENCVYGKTYLETPVDLLPEYICDEKEFEMLVTDVDTLNYHVFIYAQRRIYTVEYYYEDVLDTTKTEYYWARLGTVITNYTPKSEGGYRLDHVENCPLMVVIDGTLNVIRVYYTKTPEIIIPDIPLGSGPVSLNVGDCFE